MAKINVDRENSNRVKVRKLYQYQKMAIAVTLAIAVLFTGFFVYHLTFKSTESVQVAYKNDIEPGVVGATLTLANGKRIKLSDVVSGELAIEAGIKITKTTDGQVVYSVLPTKKKLNDGSSGANTLLNTLSTAKGETYQVRLPDGSKVWLNAASVLTYPTNFTGAKERIVILEGEAYFEIAKLNSPSPTQKTPFFVKTANQTVEVLGTHFNISSYKTKSDIRTTLLEGSIRVSTTNTSKLIKPGQQSIVKNTSIEITDTDVSIATGWKEGYFVFKDEELSSIMQDVSRWYNVEVQYEGDSDKKTFGGRISRSRTLSEVLERLALTCSVRFRIEEGFSGKERRIIVIY